MRRAIDASDQPFGWFEGMHTKKRGWVGSMFYRWVESDTRDPFGYMVVDCDPMTKRRLFVVFPLAPVVSLCRKLWWDIDRFCYGSRRRNSKLWQEGCVYGRALVLSDARDEKTTLVSALRRCTCGAVGAVIKEEREADVEEASAFAKDAAKSGD